jgi:hypothetical protein
MCFLVDEKIKLKVLTWSLILLTNFENLLVTRFKDHTATILRHWKCIQEAACDSVKSHWKSPVTRWFLRISPCSQWDLQKLILSFLTCTEEPYFSMHQVEDPKLIVSFHLTGPLQPLNSALAHPLLNLLDVHLDLAKQVQGCSHSALLWPSDVSTIPRQAGTMLQPLSSSLAQWCFI